MIGLFFFYNLINIDSFIHSFQAKLPIDSPMWEFKVFLRVFLGFEPEPKVLALYRVYTILLNLSRHKLHEDIDKWY